MPASNVMNDSPDAEQSLAQTLRAFNDEVTEFGIRAETAFKEAAEALFGQELAITASVSAARANVGWQHNVLHETALALLVLEAGRSSRESRRIVELQQTALEFRRVIEHANTISELAQALGGSGELVLQRAECVDPLVLRRIVRQTYLLIRGAVIV